MMVLKRIFLVAVCACAFGIDDVFDNIPSQFSGWSFAVHGGALAPAGDFEFELEDDGAVSTTILREPAAPLVRLSTSYLRERDLWVTGGQFFVESGFTDVEFFVTQDVVFNSQYKYSMGGSGRLGFLFNPATLVSVHAGGGYARYGYHIVSDEAEEHSAWYADVGVSSAVGILMTWALELDLGGRFYAQNAFVALSGDGPGTAVAITPSKYAVYGTIAMVYRADS
ncbi:hypothetical protein [Candidatus Synchoanobacter obligatus]|uniref:Outer membrane protein beta-barrel domain-containing protein n=1 Tax=Candidatus Synchoanobacter obligatus TaxID=2919597 RepID=A0ABT1L514_9GAMM|nr:hypothetical protein [Candidatus Synchoanobacter obligatus]MCP8352006.1 hypothetical protein [Candidatus Synchoanobacter obligatus]